MAFATLAMGPVTVLGALATIVVSGAATYTLSSGILVPALALLLGLWLRRPGWYLLILLAGTVGWPATYLWGYETPSVHSDPADFFSHPGAVINHFLIQLGSPFANAMDWTSQLTAAAVAGAVILAAYFGGLIVVFLRPSTPQQKTIAMLSIFLVGWAFLTALGRARFGPDQALSSRYLTPLTALWLSILLLWLSATASRPLMRLLTLAIGALIAAGAAASEFRMVDTGLNFVLGRKLATPALIAGVDDPILFKLHPRPDVVLEERANLLRFHTSVFAEDWTRLMGEKFADHFRVANNAYCSGSFVQVQAIDVAATGWSVIGAAWRNGSLDPLRRIVLTGEDGRIVGYGIGGFDARSVWEADPQAPAAPVWWIGDLKAGDPAKVRAYAVDDKAGACMIGFLPAPGESEVALAPMPAPPPDRAGFIDFVAADEFGLRISGWGYLSSRMGRVFIDTDLPVKSIAVSRTSRPDVVRATNDKSMAHSGIGVRLRGGRNLLSAGPHRLCVWTDDPKYGRRLLNNVSSSDPASVFLCESPAGAAGTNPQ